jgi:hypothetical protein
MLFLFEVFRIISTGTAVGISSKKNLAISSYIGILKAQTVMLKN